MPEKLSINSKLTVKVLTLDPSYCMQKDTGSTSAGCMTCLICVMHDCSNCLQRHSNLPPEEMVTLGPLYLHPLLV